MTGSRREFLAAVPTALLATALSGSASVSAGRAQNETETARMKIQRLEWAGIKIEFKDAAVFIDATRDRESSANSVELTTTLPSRTALITHHHGDHCDPLSLKPVLASNGRIVCHHDVAPWFDHHGIQVQTVALHQPVFFSRASASLAAWAVPAVDGMGHPQNSWIIDGAGKRIIHCGDTLWHGYWWDIARAYGPFDVAFLPINGFQQWDGHFAVKSEMPMSLTPDQAAAAAHVLGARLVVPIHYGLTGNPNYSEVAEPLETFLKSASKRALPTKVLGYGEYLEI
jgi:L-ascorbate metabolism protein UlaG (beta-lactamase superfamily)